MLTKFLLTTFEVFTISLINYYASKIMLNFENLISSIKNIVFNKTSKEQDIFKVL